jgi:hypothetical protein
LSVTVHPSATQPGPVKRLDQQTMTQTMTMTQVTQVMSPPTQRRPVSHQQVPLSWTNTPPPQQ